MTAGIKALYLIFLIKKNAHVSISEDICQSQMTNNSKLPLIKNRAKIQSIQELHAVHSPGRVQLFC